MIFTCFLYPIIYVSCLFGDKRKNDPCHARRKGATIMGKLDYTPCPRCTRGTMRSIGERKGGFSGGKAALGAVIAGPIGLAAGALGRKKTLYACDKCGYTIED